MTNGNGSNDFNAHERAVVAYQALIGGDELTTGEVARLTGLTWHGAAKMMNSISRVVPVIQDVSNGASRWKLFNCT